MKLGIIGKLTENSFRETREHGLDFIELTINGGDDVDGFIAILPQVREWMVKYSLAIGSIGRWKAQILRPDGTIDPVEIDIARKLIDAASELGSPHYICGCNAVSGLSYFENTQRAIDFFSLVLEHARKRDILVSTATCRKQNFVNTPMAWTLIHGHLPELGIKYDPSHAVYHGGDYLAETSQWGHLFRHVHLKGALVVDGQRVDDPPAGMDGIDWKKFLSILRARDYDGGLSIEPHSDHWVGERRKQGVDFTIRYMNGLLVGGVSARES